MPERGPLTFGVTAGVDITTVKAHILYGMLKGGSAAARCQLRVSGGGGSDLVDVAAPIDTSVVFHQPVYKVEEGLPFPSGIHAIITGTGAVLTLQFAEGSE